MIIVEIIAHKTDKEIQLLNTHLINVSAISEKFAASFANSDWASYAGILHDLGKAFPEWQKYIRGEQSTSINHSEAGAQYAFSKMGSMSPFDVVISYLIAGHHAGLPNYIYDAGKGNDLNGIVKEKSYENLLNIPELKEILNTPFPKSMPFGKNDLSKDNPNELMEHFHLWIRMLFVKNGNLFSLKIKEIKEWDNGLEGWITAEFSDGRRLTFFDADYSINKDKYEIEKTYNFILGALAYSAAEPESKGFKFEGKAAIDLWQKWVKHLSMMKMKVPKFQLLY